MATVCCPAIEWEDFPARLQGAHRHEVAAAAACRQGDEVGADPGVDEAFEIN